MPTCRHLGPGWAKPWPRDDLRLDSSEVTILRCGGLRASSLKRHLAESLCPALPHVRLIPPIEGFTAREPVGRLDVVVQ
jgi:hypothetical protein